MANESPTSPQLSHGSCRSSEGRMTACPPDQRRPLSRVFDEEVSLAQHVGHDTAVDDRLSWRAADTGAALGRPATQKCYTGHRTKRMIRVFYVIRMYTIAYFILAYAYTFEPWYS